MSQTVRNTFVIPFLTGPNLSELIAAMPIVIFWNALRSAPSRRVAMGATLATATPR